MKNAQAKNLFYLRQISDVLSMQKVIAAGKKIVLIDYGMCNTLSVLSAIKYLGLNCELTNDIEKISNAEYVVLLVCLHKKLTICPK